MNKNKKITLVTLMALTTFAATGCGQTTEDIKADEELAEELVLDTYAALGYDAFLAGMKSKADEVNIDMGSDKYDFISQDVIDKSNKELDKIKNKALRSVTEMYIDTADETNDLLEDYASGTINDDELSEELANVTNKGNDKLNKDVKLKIKLTSLAKKHNLENKIDDLQDNVTKRLEKNYSEKIKSLLSNVLVDAVGNELNNQLSGLASESQDNQSSDTTEITNNSTSNNAFELSNIGNSSSSIKDASSDINKIKSAASEFNSIDYKKGEYEVVDTIAGVISDFYKNGLNGVNVELYELKSDYDTKKDYYVPISSETKQKIESERQEVLNSIKSGYDSVKISSFYYTDVPNYSDHSNDITDSIQLNFNISHVGKDGKAYMIFGNEFTSFNIVKENGTWKIAIR